MRVVGLLAREVKSHCWEGVDVSFWLCGWLVQVKDRAGRKGREERWG